MSKIREVIKNRNLAERVEKARRKEDLSNLRAEAAYRAYFVEELKKIDMLLSDLEVKYIEIEVEEKELSKFSRMIYSPELAEYDIEQDKEHANRFRIYKKFLVF